MIASMASSTNNPLAWIEDELERLDRDGLRRRLVVRVGRQSAGVEIDGRALANFGSNDYLGLAAEPRLAAAARAVSEREGWGSGASPLVSGRGSAHAELERRLADFEGTEAALVFPSGFAANAGVIPTLVEEPDAIFGDAKNHASLIDGCRLSKATRFVYPHADCDALEMMLREAGKYRRRLVVTDTLFSMDGDLAPLPQLAELARQYDAMLMVDEAHATGVFGARGRGVVEELDAGGSSQRRRVRGEEREPSLDPHERVHIRVGTLSKALGSGGGFVCGSQSLIDWLANRARTYVFSTAQPAATSAAAIAALDIVELEPDRRQKLQAAAKELRERLRNQGWNTGESASQIIPLIVGDPNRTMELAAGLREAGYFVPGIRPPSVPEGESLLRLSLCYHHTPEAIDGLLKELARMR
jgi:8-amino-7-oxononanoate synthase